MRIKCRLAVCMPGEVPFSYMHSLIIKVKRSAKIIIKIIKKLIILGWL